MELALMETLTFTFKLLREAKGVQLIQTVANKTLSDLAGVSQCNTGLTHVKPPPSATKYV